MNIFDTIYEINKHHLQKCAMSITTDSGEKRIYTYGEAFEKAEEYAELLVNAGVKAGDRVAFVSESCPEWNIAFFASCKIRATAALVDASLTGDEIDDFVTRSDVRAAFFSPKAAAKIGDFSKYQFPIFNILDGSIYETSVKTVSADLPATDDADTDVACIIFSSGTTRKSAGVMHYHHTLIETAQMTINVQGLNENDRYLGLLPNSHIYGLICLIMGPHLTGADVHFVDSLTAENILAAFAEYHPTILPAVPKVYELFRNAIMRKINSKKATKVLFEKFFPICYDLRKKNGSLLGKKIFSSINEGLGGSLRVLCSAGAPLSKEVADFYYGVGLNILITYGATETNIPTIGNVLGDIQPDSCGKPYPAIKLEMDESGEFLIKSPFLMKGYFRDEEATKEMFTEDGWFKTGDVGFIDDKGYVHVTGRSKENIVLATGKKITPDDIEEKYLGIDGVKEMVICGVPVQDKDYDEVHMFVVPEFADLKAKIEEQIKAKGVDLVQYMKIAKVHFLDEIPRTSGLAKPKRYLLKKFAMEHGNDVEFAEEITVDDETTFGKIIKIVSMVSGTSASQLSTDTKLFVDLALDSLSSVDLAMEIESVFGIDAEKSFNKDMTIGDVVSLVDGGIVKIEETEQNENEVYPKDKTDGDYRFYNTVRNVVTAFHKVSVDGADNIPDDKGYIICANHVSKLDYLYIAEALSKEKFQKLCCMAKKELFKDSPIHRQLIKSTGMVPMDRGGMNNAKSMKALCEKLNDNWGVVIHPEGTRSEDGVFRSMKHGASVLAVEANAPIVPAYISGALEACPKGTKLIKFYNWEKKEKYQIDVNFGEPVYPDGKTVEEITAEVQNAILKLQDECKK